jgi:hypothetical protein
MIHQTHVCGTVYGEIIVNSEWHIQKQLGAARDPQTRLFMTLHVQIITLNNIGQKYFKIPEAFVMFS